jgi:ribonuclease P protein component
LLQRLKTAEQFATVLDASKQRLAPLQSEVAYISGVWRSAHFALHVASYEAFPLDFMAGLKVVNPSVSQPKGHQHATIGVICPKRWAKRAVTRNTIKRQIYAVSSELAPQLPAACLVLRLTTGFAPDQFVSASSAKLKSAVRAELLMLFSKLLALSKVQA